MPQTTPDDSTLLNALFRLRRTAEVREAMEQTPVRTTKQTLAKPFSNAMTGRKRRRPRASEDHTTVENIAKRVCGDGHKINSQLKSGDRISKRSPHRPARRSARLRKPTVEVSTKSSESDQPCRDETDTAASPTSEPTPNNSEPQEHLPGTKAVRGDLDEKPKSPTSAPSRPLFTLSIRIADPLPPQGGQQLPTHRVPLPPFSTFHEFSSLPLPTPQSRPIPTLKLPSFTELLASISTSQPPPRTIGQDSYETYSGTSHTSDSYHI